MTQTSFDVNNDLIYQNMIETKGMFIPLYIQQTSFELYQSFFHTYYRSHHYRTATESVCHCVFMRSSLAVPLDSRL